MGEIDSNRKLSDIRNGSCGSKKVIAYFNSGEQIWSAAALQAAIFSSREYFLGRVFAVLLPTA